MRGHLLRLLGLLGGLVALPAWALTWQATVVHVGDGDTLYVRAEGELRSVAVRLLGIDAPEICQDGGQAARQALVDIALHQRVTLVGVGQDVYGRELARVFLHGQDLGRQLVALGLAWSQGLGRSAGPYAREQAEARAAQRGLFAQTWPQMPHDFRLQHGSCHATPPGP